MGGTHNIVSQSQLHPPTNRRYINRHQVQVTSEISLESIPISTWGMERQQRIIALWTV